MHTHHPHISYEQHQTASTMDFMDRFTHQEPSTPPFTVYPGSLSSSSFHDYHTKSTGSFPTETTFSNRMMEYSAVNSFFALKMPIRWEDGENNLLIHCLF